MTTVSSFRFLPENSNLNLQVRQEMKEKGFERNKAMDSVRLQKLMEVCGTKENTTLYLLEEWNYEPQVSFYYHCFFQISKFKQVEVSHQNTNAPNLVALVLLTSFCTFNLPYKYSFRRRDQT